MAERSTTVDGLADAIMDGLKEYADLATDTVKEAVKDVSKNVKRIYRQMPQNGQEGIRRVGRSKNSREQQLPYHDGPF